MRQGVDEFVHHQNVANYAIQLRASDDPVRRRLLLCLLREESSAARANGWLAKRG